MAEPVVNVGKRQAEPILSVRDLEVTFGGRRGGKKVIDGVSFDLHAGETLSLVGEFGSGKTTIGREILGLAPVTGGSITFRGDKISNISRPLRRTLANSILVEPLRAAGVEGGASRVKQLLDAVGLPKDASSRYPREFSGGQRQRVAIARALAMDPAVIVCDEPTSALDVTTQARVLTLFKDLQKATGVASLVNSHDLGVVN